MAKPKVTKKIGKTIHHSVCALIKEDNKILIIERALPPPGFACIAGHIDKGEKASEALIREVKEETNLDITSKRYLFRKFITQKENCSRGTKHHIYYLYDCKAKGKIKTNKREVRSIRYMTKQEIKKLYKQGKIEYSWEILFKKLGVI